MKVLVELDQMLKKKKCEHFLYIPIMNISIEMGGNSKMGDNF